MDFRKVTRVNFAFFQVRYIHFEQVKLVIAKRNRAHHNSLSTLFRLTHLGIFGELMIGLVSLTVDHYLLLGSLLLVLNIIPM
jgi:hypothetical protein